MRVLLNDEIELRIIKDLEFAKFDVNIVSAFCKKNTLEYLDGFIGENVRKRLLVRFLPIDIRNGATDKEIFAYCNNNNWLLYYDFCLHAKTYVFDKIKCIIGSANITNRGLGVSINSNKEAASYFELDDESYNKVMTLYKDSHILTKDVYDKIVSKIRICDDFVEEKLLKVDDTINCLMPEDFPNQNTDLIELYNLKSFKWLTAYLKSKDTKNAYFGELSEKIHNIFIKDPRPYRKDIKDHLVDLFSAIKRIKPEGLNIIKPNYSECVEIY